MSTGSSRSLYRRVLGADFERLPPQVRALHDVSETSEWTGDVDVRRGASLIARLMCRAMGLPPDGRGLPLTVVFTVDADDREVWQRLFAGMPFRSVLSARGQSITERIGFLTVHYRLIVTDNTLSQTVERATLLGIPLPRALHPRIESVEAERAGVYCFLVDAHLPLLGLLVHYEGRLTQRC